MYIWAIRLILLIERQDKHDSQANGIPMEVYAKKAKPTVLIFLPGLSEINELYRALDRLCEM